VSDGRLRQGRAGNVPAAKTLAVMAGEARVWQRDAYMSAFRLAPDYVTKDSLQALGFSVQRTCDYSHFCKSRKSRFPAAERTSRAHPCAAFSLNLEAH
jgi:hypothetical protein